MDNDWIKFGLAVGVCCLIFPPLLGIIGGIALFCGVWYFIFKTIGG
jgi:hypothetical protein